VFYRIEAFVDHEVKVFDSVDQLILESQAVAELSAQDKLHLVAEAAEMWRNVPAAAHALVKQVFDALSRVNMAIVNFSITRTIFSDECVNIVRAAGIPEKDIYDILLNALQIFLDAVQSGQVTDKTFLLNIVREVARAVAATYAPKPPPVKAELYTERQVSRVFKAGKPSLDLLHQLGVRYVTYQPEIAPGSFGQDIRGLAFVPRSDLPPAKRPFAPGQLFVLLETGEHVVLPDNLINLAGINNAEEYDKLPAVLLLHAVLAAPLLVRMGVVTKDAATQMQAAFGTVTKPYAAVVGDVSAIVPLEQVFIRGVERAANPTASLANITGPTGAVVRFPVQTETHECAIVLNARITPSGYYLVSSLIKTNGETDDTLLMKNDYPRQLSPYGIYAFPREDALYALLVFPHNFVFSGAA
jgi:hypothetical protein